MRMPIEERIKQSGEKSYRVVIRKKGQEISRTFSNLDDAKVFEYYRNRLIENMANFDVPIQERVRLDDIIELKLEGINDARTIDEFKNSAKKVKENIKHHMFISELAIDDWVECFKKISCLLIPIRKNSKEMTLASPLSVRRWFAVLSSAFSYAISKGIRVENYPLQIVQKYINPKLRSKA